MEGREWENVNEERWRRREGGRGREGGREGWACDGSDLNVVRTCDGLWGGVRLWMGDRNGKKLRVVRMRVTRMFG